MEVQQYGEVPHCDAALPLTGSWDPVARLQPGKAMCSLLWVSIPVDYLKFKAPLAAGWAMCNRFWISHWLYSAQKVHR